VNAGPVEDGPRPQGQVPHEEAERRRSQTDEYRPIVQVPCEDRPEDQAHDAKSDKTPGDALLLHARSADNRPKPRSGGAALNGGLTREEIIEAILHASVYAGFPRALNATFVAREVFAERDAAD